MNRASGGEAKPAAVVRREEGVHQAKVWARGRACLLAQAVVFLALSAVAAQARFSFQPGLSFSSLWSDNVFGSSTAPEADISYVASPSLSFSQQNARGGVYFTLSAAVTRYRRLIQLNRESLGLSVDATHNFTSRTSISFYNSFSYIRNVTTQTAEFAEILTEAGIITTIIQRGVVANEYDNSMTFSFFHDFSRRTRFSAFLTRNDTIFTNSLFNNTASNSLRAELRHEFGDHDWISMSLRRSNYKYGNKLTDDRTTAFSAQYRHSRNQRTEYTLEVRLEDNIDERPTDNQIFKSKNIFVEGGVVGRLNRQWDVEIVAGLRHSRKSGDLSPEEKPSEAGTIFRIELNRKTRLSALRLRVSRQFNPSVRFGFETTFLGADYSRNVCRDLTWNASLSYASNKTGVGGGTVTNTLFLSTGLFWIISERADISIQLSSVDQTQTTDETSVKVKRSTISFALNLKYVVKR